MAAYITQTIYCCNIYTKHAKYKYKVVAHFFLLKYVLITLGASNTTSHRINYHYYRLYTDCYNILHH